MGEKKDYYVGFDCGTSSVGWAVTDEEYNILKAKGQRLWGVRLFEEADTAADRRAARSARRRTGRVRNRVKLLNMLFADEIAKVDPNFYTRLRESFYWEEDKNFDDAAARSKNTLFNDPDFKDKDFHKKYPTIWHLRKAIIESDEHFDIRLYYLAIHHIIKNRGHFLFEGSMTGGVEFKPIFERFAELAEEKGYVINRDNMEAIEILLKNKKMGKMDKKRELKNLLFVDTGDSAKGYTELAGLLVGSSVNLFKIFEIESDEKPKSWSLASGNFDENVVEIEDEIGTENIDLVTAAKQIYDFVILNNLLAGETSISNAMVRNYQIHQKDLKELKAVFKEFPDVYNLIFKAKIVDEKNPSYNHYIGKAYSEDKKGRRKSASPVPQEDFNAFLKKKLEACGYTGELLARAEMGELLPKQKGQAKGTIPMQLHANELRVMVEKLCRDYPSFAVEAKEENSDCKTKGEKIIRIHNFRIPYYCGPLVKRKYAEDGTEVEGGRSAFSWADEEINELVYPWNFNQLVDLDSRASNFIHRMTNSCTYLAGEEVLPKCSPLYQKYMVLMELNNLKIDGKRIADVRVKQEIFERAFLGGELTGNVTLKNLKAWMFENGYLEKGQELGGTNEVKYLPKLTTHQDFVRCLGADYAKKYDAEKLEEVVEAITVLGEERKMLQRRILAVLNCSEDEAKKLAKLTYKDWGRLSAAFLNGIRTEIEGRRMSMIEALFETNNNLMELLSSKFGFKEIIENYGKAKRKEGAGVTYEDVQNLYCSPAVKRTVWQTLRVLKELVQVEGHAPKKVFLEVTREDNDERGKAKHIEKSGLNRKKKLLEKYSKFKAANRDLYDKLNEMDDRKLQSKKLYLYFMQQGKCAYSGEPINLEELNNSALYDIEHIYPRSLTKDDSLERNLVLVKAELNRMKSNTYPIPEEIRAKMAPTWRAWAAMDLIDKAKLNRLTRSEPLTAQELGDFIARQIVETSQSVKAIRDLIQQGYPGTKVIMVKGNQVSNFRKLFGEDKKDEDGRLIGRGQYEFLKVRELNDFHHAKDAYLNIVVGNVMNLTFTDDPWKWIKDRGGKEYSINPKVIFRASEVYTKKDGGTSRWPEVEGWAWQESIDKVSWHLKRNDVVWTKMPYVESKEISDLQIVGKCDETDGILPIKQTGRLKHTEKYGGYNSLKGAYFRVIRNEANSRRLVQIPLVYANQNREQDFVEKNYPGFFVVGPKIGFKGLVEVDGFRMHISGRTGNSIMFQHARQCYLSYEYNGYLKNLIRAFGKIKESKGKYVVDERHDGITVEHNQKMIRVLVKKMQMLEKMPEFGAKIPSILDSVEHFDDLEINKQIESLLACLKVLGCSPEKGDLSAFVPKANAVGSSRLSNNIDKVKEFKLVNQSVTGLYEKVIDLKTVE